MPYRGTPLDGFVATANATNALATATKAAVTGKTHYITGVSASYSAAAIGTLQIKDGSTVIWEGSIHNQRDVKFKGLRATTGNAVSAELAAGGAGVVGRVNIMGFTADGA